MRRTGVNEVACLGETKSPPRRERTGDRYDEYRRPVDGPATQSSTGGVTRRGVLAVGAVGAAGGRTGRVLEGRVAGQSDGREPDRGYPRRFRFRFRRRPLAKLSDIKVGEAISATGPDGAKIIIARPTQDTVAAFSAICTHQGCAVVPAGKELDCPCHGSVYNASTGAVINGPAPRPLAAVNVKISGDNVIAG